MPPIAGTHFCIGSCIVFHLFWFSRSLPTSSFPLCFLYVSPVLFIAYPWLLINIAYIPVVADRVRVISIHPLYFLFKFRILSIFSILFSDAAYSYIMPIFLVCSGDPINLILYRMFVMINKKCVSVC